MSRDSRLSGVLHVLLHMAESEGPVTSEDLARATAFYRELLGVAPSASYDPPGLVFFDLDGTRLLLDRVAPTPRT